MTQLITYEAEGAVGTQVVPILPPEEFARIKICLNCPLPACHSDSLDCPLQQLPPIGRQVRDSGVYCPHCGGIMGHATTRLTQKHGNSHEYRCRGCRFCRTIREAELSQKAREALRQ